MPHFACSQADYAEPRQTDPHGFGFTGISHPHTGFRGTCPPTGLNDGTGHPDIFEGLNEGTGHPEKIEITMRNMLENHMILGTSEMLGYYGLHFKTIQMDLPCLPHAYQSQSYMRKFLLLGGDVESNPGPGFSHIISSKSLSNERRVCPFQIIHGHFSQIDQRFDDNSRGKQSTCNAIAMMCISKQNQNLTSDDIDAILIEADSLYHTLSNLLHPMSKPSEKYQQIEIPELENVCPVTVFGRQYTTSKMTSLHGSIESATSHDKSIFSLTDAMVKTLSKQPQALLMIEKYAMALVKLPGGQIGLFSSHAHSTDGSLGTPDGPAAFMMFPNENIVSRFLKQIFRACSPFEIYPVKIEQLVSEISTAYAPVQTHHEALQEMDKKTSDDIPYIQTEEDRKTDLFKAYFTNQRKHLKDHRAQSKQAKNMKNITLTAFNVKQRTCNESTSTKANHKEYFRQNRPPRSKNIELKEKEAVKEVKNRQAAKAKAIYRDRERQTNQADEFRDIRDTESVKQIRDKERMKEVESMHSKQADSTKRKFRDQGNLSMEEQDVHMHFNLCLQTCLIITCAIYLFSHYMSLLLLCAGDIETNPGPNPSKQQRFTKRQKQQLRKEQDRIRKQNERHPLKDIQNGKKNVCTCKKSDVIKIEKVDPVNVDSSQYESEYELALPCTDIAKSTRQINLIRSNTAAAVILGHFSQADEEKFGASQGQQCTCNATTMLCMWQNNKDITSEDIDAILFQGDKVFRELSLLLIQTGMSSQQYRYLEFREIELLSPLKIDDYHFTIKLSDCMSGAIHSVTTNDRSIYSLADAISLALSQKPQALMMIKSYAMALVKTSNRVGLFDSHAHSEDGSFHVADGCAAFMLFSNETGVAHFLQQNFTGHDQFDIYAVDITSERPSSRECLKTVGSAGNSNSSINKKKDIPKSCSGDRTLQKKRKHEVSSERPFSNKKQKTTNSSSAQVQSKHPKKLKAVQNKPGSSDLPQDLQTYFSHQRQRSISVKGRPDHNTVQSVNMKYWASLPKASKTQLQSNRTEYKRTYMKRYMKMKRKDLKEQEKERVAKQCARKDPKVQEKERVSKQCARKDPKVQEKERVSKRVVRQDPQRRAKERQQETISKQSARKNPETLEKERVHKQMVREKTERRAKEKQKEVQWKQAARKDSGKRDKEKARDQQLKSNKRKSNSFKKAEQENRRVRKHGNTLQDCINHFLAAVSVGPIYVCCVCLQTWFKHHRPNGQDSITKLKPKKIDRSVRKCITDTVSVDGKRWICLTCKRALKELSVPTLSAYNMHPFPEKPQELDLQPLEERLIALRIPFMQINDLPVGGQYSLKGNIVNVPVNINTTVSALPRTMEENQTIPVKLKRKLSYKSCVNHENVRPAKVRTALNWLLHNGPLYKESSIQIRDDWYNPNKDTVESANEQVHNTNNTNHDHDKPSTSAEDSPNNNSEGTQSTDEWESDDDDFSEVDENELHSGNMETLLDEAEGVSNSSVFNIAPGEGQTPLGIFQDTKAEYLSFPAIFCGQERPSNKEREKPVYYSDICKWELRCYDRRVASCVANLFFKLKKVQLKQVSNKVNLVMRRCQKKGQKVTAAQALDPSTLDHLVRLDEGYFIFRSMRNTPQYFEDRKKAIFAMIRQLGLPTWFMSLSAADTRWKDLLIILGQFVDHKTYTSDEIEEMDWEDKCRLIRSDPVTCSRYFDNRVNEFLNYVLKSSHNPLGKVTDYFTRIEFQKRGSPHVHMLLWVQDAPKYEVDSDDKITAFIDSHVSCTSDVPEDQSKYVGYQNHKHSKTCRKAGKPICRFGYPIPPMQKTQILKPLDIDMDDSEKKLHKENYSIIKTKLEQFKKDMKDNTKAKSLTFDNFLQDIIGMSEEAYIKAIRSSLKGPKVFLTRKPEDLCVNAYMKLLLSAWRANHDLQYVLDPYACAMYIVSYVSKSQRGMSALMDQACKEARRGNKDLKQQVRHIGNAFLNSVEISAQEASYLLLQIPLTHGSRTVQFINTSHPDDRTFLLKNKESLGKLSPNSTDIASSNNIKRYSRRPYKFEHLCLADYVAEINVTYPKGFKKAEMEECNDDEVPQDETDDEGSSDEEEFGTAHETRDVSQCTKEQVFHVDKHGIKYIKRKHPKVIRYVRFNKENDPENYYRERLLLFLPWRNELEDLKGPHSTYEDAYFAMKHFIDDKAQKYEQNIQVLDEAINAANIEESEAYDELAPGAQQKESDDAAEDPTESAEHAFYRPQTTEHAQCDIGVDLGYPSASVEIEPHGVRLPEDQYQDLIRCLNVKQLEIFTHVLQWIKTKEEPMRIFLTGGAGVGKSKVIDALYQTLHRYLCGTEGENPEEIRILLCAFTGVAAFNIGGTTIHKAFNIKANDKIEYRRLSDDAFNTMRMKYRHLSLIIIDEVSMVSHQLFKVMHLRLQDIKGNKKLFGGVHMLVVGDLYQLRPVFGGWIFEDLKDGYTALATNLWKDNFKMFELTEIMRQKEDHVFAELLNRLRLNNLNEEDKKTLRGRVISKTDPNYKKSAQHFFRYNADVTDHNTIIFNETNTVKAIVSARDAFSGDLPQIVVKRLLPAIAKKKTHDTANLESNLKLAESLRYMVTININIEDGLTNGADCVLKKIQYLKENSPIPSILWVLFDDNKIGKQTRNKYSRYYSSTIDRKWTPLFAVDRTFEYRGKNVVRTQFPLSQSAAKTIHKAQGSTYDEIVVKPPQNQEDSLMRWRLTV